MRRTIVNRRNRRNFDSSMKPAGTNANIVDAVIATVHITLTYDKPVSLKGIPQYTTVGANGALPTAAAFVSATQIQLTYPATQAASTAMDVPEKDAAVRTADGGYAQAATFPLV